MTCQQSWAHATTVAPTRHHFKIKKYYIIFPLNIVLKLHFNSEGQPVYFSVSQKLQRCRNVEQLSQAQLCPTRSFMLGVHNEPMRSECLTIAIASLRAFITQAFPLQNIPLKPILYYLYVYSIYQEITIFTLISMRIKRYCLDHTDTSDF